MENFITARAAARVMGVTTTTMINWCEAGHVPGFSRNPGPRGHYRIPVAWVEANRPASFVTDPS